jgi:hypothetical protein
VAASSILASGVASLKIIGKLADALQVEPGELLAMPPKRARAGR